MKYSNKEFLHKNNLLSHLVLNCISDSVDGETDVIGKVANSKEYRETGELDICLFFNGHEVKFDRFLKTLEDDFNRLLDEKVQERVDAIMPEIDSDSLQEMEDKINNVLEEYKSKLLSKHIHTHSCCENCLHGFEKSGDFVMCEMKSPDSNTHYYNFVCENHTKEQ
jgi:hypothetical protein